jgi:DNA-binding MarR family transcriptional regulator
MNDLATPRTDAPVEARNDASCESASARSLPFLLLGLAHEIEAGMEEALAPVGLSLAKLRLLTKLVEAGEPVPLGCLADQCSCVRSNMTQLVDRLETESLVERRNDARDRRSVQAGLTELGRRRQREGAERLASFEARSISPLSAADREQLERLISLLRNVL